MHNVKFLFGVGRPAAASQTGLVIGPKAAFIASIKQVAKGRFAFVATLKTIPLHADLHGG